MADSQADLIDPGEVAVQTRRPEVLPGRVPPRPSPSTGRGRARRGRRWAVVFVLAVGVVLGAGLFVFLNDGAGTDSDDPLRSALFDYTKDVSGGAITDENATCMAESFIDSIGRDRLVEVGIVDGADLQEVLSPEELTDGLPPAMGCLDDAQFEALITSTLEPSVLAQLAPAQPDCLAHGWLAGFGRDQMIDVWVIWASRGSSDFTALLAPDELATLGQVVSECSAAATAATTATTAP